MWGNRDFIIYPFVSTLLEENQGYCVARLEWTTNSEKSWSCGLGRKRLCGYFINIFILLWIFSKMSTIWKKMSASTAHAAHRFFQVCTVHVCSIQLTVLYCTTVLCYTEHSAYVQEWTVDWKLDPAGHHTVIATSLSCIHNCWLAGAHDWTPYCSTCILLIYLT